jgi:hypothetical protein
LFVIPQRSGGICFCFPLVILTLSAAEGEESPHFAFASEIGPGFSPDGPLDPYLDADDGVAAARRPQICPSDPGTTLQVNRCNKSGEYCCALI